MDDKEHIEWYELIITLLMLLIWKVTNQTFWKWAFIIIASLMLYNIQINRIKINKYPTYK